MQVLQSIVYFVIFLVFCYFFKDNACVKGVIKDHSIKIIAAFLALNFMDFLNERRSRGYVSYVEESMFTIKYGSLVLAISLFYVIVMSLYLAIAVKWYLIFIPLPIVSLAWITSPLLNHYRVMLIFLLVYPITLVWAIVDFFF